MKSIRLLILSVLLALLCALHAQAQKPESWSSSEIYHKLKGLQVLGSALYVAAHPDDENTRLISWLVNDQHVRTAYLSLTRGDGGQNLIGAELAELLGAIRTQELLAARRIDKGYQFFTRAIDFGFSKNPEETMRIWNRSEVLSDVVQVIRTWRPDVVVMRFSPDSGGNTHGHHTASAILAREGWEQAGNPDAFPKQLHDLETWQPRRLFFNTSWWFYGSREAFDKADKSNLVAVDAGAYFPLSGQSNSEIAAQSRSMHKSQGFGSIGTRGSQAEYLQLLRGDMPADRGDLFDGINTTWSRLEGGEPIGKLLHQIELDFRHDNPAASVPALLQAYNMAGRLPDSYWKRVKMEDMRDLITACLGLFAEAVADDQSATPGRSLTLNLEIINRSQIRVVLQALRYVPTEADTTMNLTLDFNTGVTWKKHLTLPGNVPYSSAYWLDKPWSTGMYTIDDPQLIGLPETPREFKVMFSLNVAGYPIVIEREVVYKFDDDVKGEVYRPFEVTPPVFASFSEPVFLFTNDEGHPVDVVLRAGVPTVNGVLQLSLPKGWRAEPEAIPFELSRKGEEATYRFTVFPPSVFTEGKISPVVKVGDATYNKAVVIMDYDHIPRQTILLPSTAKVARMDLRKAGERVAYIMGAGDKVPESLRQIGYSVDVLSQEDIQPGRLDGYDAVVLGIRAYNVLDRMKFNQPLLFDYVRNGGVLVAQYNVSRGLTLPAEELAPYPLRLSRTRVTVEDAEVRLLAPEHPALNFPNKITAKDFEGWVQERGLYFPDEWAPEFTPLLACNDPGEKPADGSLLVAKYGNGYYVYTGLSFFRELPAGVPGAYRLFTNLLSLGGNGD